MFSVAELRLIRHAISKEVDTCEKKLKILNPDSDDSIEIGNDLSLPRIILEKIAMNKDV